MINRVRDKVLMGALAVVLLVVAGVVAFTASRGDGGPDAGPPVSLPASASPTVTPTADPNGDVSQKAIVVYNGYWLAYVAAAAVPSGATPDLARYVADPLLTNIRLELRQSRELGIVYKGRPMWSPHATSVNLARKPQTVTIEDCFDAATWEPIFSKTGKSAAAPGQATRYVITSTVTLFEGTGWLLADSMADRTRSC